MAMQTNSEWGVFSFGLGAFQRCQIEAWAQRASDSEIKIHDVDAGVENCIAIPNGQNMSIGLRVYGGSDFINTLEKNLALFLFSYHLIKDGIELQQESTARIPFTKGKENVGARFQRVQNGAIISTISKIKVASCHLNAKISLAVEIALDLASSGAFALNRVTDMDAEEKDVRYLMELNRFQPPKIPSRKLLIMKYDSPKPLFCVY